MKLKEYYKKINFNPRSVVSRIALILAVSGITTIAVGAIGITKIHQMHQVAQDIYSSNTSVLFPLTEYLAAMQRAESTAEDAIRGNRSAVSNFSRDVNDVTGQVGNFSSFLPDKILMNFNKRVVRYDVSIKTLYNDMFQNSPNAQSSYNKYRKESRTLYQYVFELNRELRRSGMKSYSRGKKVFDSAIALQGWLTGLGVLIAIVIGVFVARSIIRPLHRLLATTDQLAKGNLKARANINSDDEVGVLGQSFDRAVDELRTMVNDASEHAKNVTTSSTELFQVIDHTSQALEEINHLVTHLIDGATRQNLSVTSTIKTIQTANEKTNSMTSATLSIDKACREVAQLAERGGAATVDMQKTIEILVTTVRDIDEMIRTLASDSRQIQQLVDMISDIAEKTTLLSLNASIEAARAGEHGRGFEVVAFNIRDLSERAKESVVHINNVIKNIRQRTDKVVDGVQQGVSEVEKGRNTMFETAKLFNALVIQVDNITTQISTIANDASRVYINNEAVITEMGKVTDISQDNLASVEQVAATLQEQYSNTLILTDAAKRLQTLSKRLMSAAQRFDV